ncbi:MAG: hypothetical protein AAGC61_03045 [Microbacterium sp.]
MTPEVRRRSAARAAALLIVTAFASLSLVACTAVELSPEERAREIAERWVDASRTGDEESAQALSCGPILGGVNSDLPELKSHSLEIAPQEDGQFIVEVTESFSDYPDLVTRLGVRTDGEACISWVR